MRVIGSLAGRTTFRWSTEDVAPPAGFTFAMWFHTIAARYNFQSAPDPAQAQQILLQSQIAGAPGGIPPNPPSVTFRSGALKAGRHPGAIHQLDLILGVSTAVVSAQNTDITDAFVDDFAQVMETALGFHGFCKHVERKYGSIVVVEFERAIEESFATLGKITSLIRQANSVIGVDGDYGSREWCSDAIRCWVPYGDVWGYLPVVIERRSLHPFASINSTATVPSERSVSLTCSKTSSEAPERKQDRQPL